MGIMKQCRCSIIWLKSFFLNLIICYIRWNISHYQCENESLNCMFFKYIVVYDFISEIR